MFKIGYVADKYENGGRGPKTIGRTAGDFGGASYGRYQLSSRTGTLKKFLVHAGERGYPEIATKAFDAWWVDNAERLDVAAHDFIRITHYEPMRRNVKMWGLGATGAMLRWAEASTAESIGAMEEMIFSTSVQYGASSSVLRAVAESASTEKMDELISAMGWHKQSTVDRYFKSSSFAVQVGVKGRFIRSWADYMGILGWSAPADLSGVYGKTKYGPGTKQWNAAVGMLHLRAGIKGKDMALEELVRWFQREAIPYDGVTLDDTNKVDQRTALNILASSMYHTSKGDMGIALSE